MGDGRRGRAAFWIDDRVIDQYGPVLEQYPIGADALAVYTVLARRAGRAGESWERVKPMAKLAATKERTFQRCIRLLELLGLVAVDSCYFAGTNIQTSNRYTLLTPPHEPPHVDFDPANWPPPARRVVFVSKGPNRAHVTDARPKPESGDAPEASAALPAPPPGCRADTTPGVMPTPTPRPADTSPGAALTPQEGNTTEGNTRKEESSRDGKKRDGKTASDVSCLPSGRLALWPTFVIDEIGLTNRQVWAATLGELARRGDVGRAELESWLRPAALIGRDGPTLIVGAPNAVTRDRIATRLLPAVREALGATIGAPVAVSVVVKPGCQGDDEPFPSTPRHPGIPIPSDPEVLTP
jgi:hypothetical protein